MWKSKTRNIKKSLTFTCLVCYYEFMKIDRQAVIHTPYNILLNFDLFSFLLSINILKGKLWNMNLANKIVTLYFQVLVLCTFQQPKMVNLRTLVFIHF